MENAVLKGHYFFKETIVNGGTNLGQTNIIPQIGDFDELVNQAQFYQSYIVRKVHYKLRVVTPSTSLAGTRLPTGTSQPVVGLMDVFRVRLQTNQIPAISPVNYCAYNNMRHDYSDIVIQGSFVPIISVSEGQSRTFKANQEISTDNLTVKHYGESILWSLNEFNVGPLTYTVTGIISVEVQFKHYDGIQLSSLLAKKLKVMKKAE